MADDSKGGRIAIKFGAPSSSSSHSSKSKPKSTPASSLGKRPRTHAFGGGGGDSDSDDDDKKRGQHEAITGFGVNGAETERARSKEEAKKKKEYVIARQPNRDWRDEIRAQRGARRSKNLLPAEARAAAAQDGASGSSMDTAAADQDSGIQWGLTVKEKKPADAETPSAAAADDDDDNDDGKETPIQAEPAQPPPPQSADDEAMDALLGKRPAKDTPKVIVTEDDAYTRDVSAAGAASTLADYDAMPVEEFGAALLRGMGWNGEPSSSKSNKARMMPQRRQNRLGLGAKALNEAEDLGGWNQKGPGSGAGKKRPPKLADYRREEERKRERRGGGGGGGRGESYKREREREREERRRGDGERERGGHRHVDRDEERERERHRGYDRDRRR
ncbi:hypothetical protein MY10362_003399 [Beauveria mimosiformis]